MTSSLLGNITHSFKRCFRITFLKKPLSISYDQSSEKLERHLSLFDLICIGVGGTVGSGVFVLTGLIANGYAGPGVILSWLIAGVCSLFSALSYAELSCLLPSSGSAYTYVYHTIGELPAIIAAWCVSLEYGISGAAVARSWGDKLIDWLLNLGVEIPTILNPGYEINILAALIQLGCVLLLLMGVGVGKKVINFFSILKILLIVFIIIAGLMLYNNQNLKPFAPMGSKGIIRGATSAFFGYVGYDEVCCLAGEAMNPHETLPKAVLGTIFLVTFLYIFAAIALVGMESYLYISQDSGFSNAFESNGWIWAQHVVAIGELVTLPVVVLVSFLAQPRLQYAMAEDGLLPKIFSEIDSKGDLTKSMIIIGIVCTLIALFVPFTHLDNMISAGILISFNLTNSALILVRRASDFAMSRSLSNKLDNLNTSVNSNHGSDTPLFPDTSFDEEMTNINVYIFHTRLNISSSKLCKIVLFMFHIFAILFCFSLSDFGFSISVVFYAILIILCSLVIYYYCPEKIESTSEELYKVPYVPFTPMIGMLVNYFLLSQLVNIEFL